ncbi:MAG: hypothetical protein JNL97_06830, partial [Verrucomicrobiales bacterium]|nr:hypothetical protein [Verrucomicrobiales bacterium]
VRDLTPGAAGSQLAGLTPVGERLFFSRSDGPDTWSLWVTDGTATGTVRVRGFQNGPAPRWDWANLGRRLLFTASDAVAGDEPWASDGTVEGTVRLKDVVSGDQGSYPRRITPGGKRAFFWAYSGEGYDLWRTDGTEAGTERVKANTPWHSPYDEITTVVDDVVYFFGPVGLWRSDGTEEGTRPVSNPSGLDLRLPFPDSMGPAQYLVPVGGTVFFIADDGVSGFELWKYGEADADGDGLSDAWEARFFGGRARPDEDPDGDGMSNRDEFRAGTDPTEARSILNIEVNRDAEAGVVQLKWASTPGREYVLRRSRGVRGAGEAVERRIPATPPLNVFREAVAEGRGPVVYRVQVEE